MKITVSQKWGSDRKWHAQFLKQFAGKTCVFAVYDAELQTLHVSPLKQSFSYLCARN